MKYGTIEIDAASLPATSTDALLRRGLAHFLGNEQAAKVSPKGAWFTGFVKANEREPTEDEINARKAELQTEAVAALVAGTVGTSIRGPAADPFETIVLRLAKADVINTLKAIGLKPPKGDEVVKFADGTTRTMEQMLANKLKIKRDVFEAEAKKIQKDQEKKAQAAKAAAEAVTDKSAEALGL